MLTDPEPTANLQRLPREPLRLELLNALRDFGETSRLSLNDPSTEESFLGVVRESIRRELANTSTLHGISAQTMFQSLVASLGKVQLIKDEDQGDAYSADNIVVPDFLIVLRDGRRLLVEVKSYYQRQPRNDFTMGRAALDALKKYAQLVGAELYIAVYWVRWNLWMLVPAAAFEEPKGQSKRMRLSMSRSMHANDMRLVGDMTIGTPPPLTFALETDPTKPQARDGDTIGFTIGAAYWTSGGKRIEDPVEQRIATFLGFFGNWEMNSNEGIFDGDRLARIEMPLVPEGDEEVIRQQGFAFIGSLSSMFSTYYRNAITDGEGGPKKLSVRTEPGFMGNLVPEPYKGKVLRLWRMIQMPNWPERDSVPAQDIAVLG